jgi:hypothetical protein
MTICIVDLQRKCHLGIRVSAKDFLTMFDLFLTATQIEKIEQSK